MSNYLYIFTRKDLSASQITVQSIHSAFEIGRHSSRMASHPRVVLIRAKNEEELRKQLSYIKSIGFPVKEFIEPYYNNSLTSFSVYIDNANQRSFFKKFKLMRNEDFMEVNYA